MTVGFRHGPRRRISCLVSWTAAFLGYRWCCLMCWALRVGRLVAAEFADPHRLMALGVSRFVRFAAHRGLRVRRSTADRLVAAARAALPSADARVACQVLADDLVLLACLDDQIAAAETKMAQLLPDTPFAPLTTVPGWGTVRAGNYAAAVGDFDRWLGARQLYRASGLSPAQSAGKRRDGGISREGSVGLRRALIDLGIGLWRADAAARRYGQQLRARGKKGGVIGCAMANRANKIAYALVRDQCGYDPRRWALTALGDSSIRPIPARAAAVNLERPQRSEDE